MARNKLFNNNIDWILAFARMTYFLSLYQFRKELYLCYETICHQADAIYKEILSLCPLWHKFFLKLARQKFSDQRNDFVTSIFQYVMPGVFKPMDLGIWI